MTDAAPIGHNVAPDYAEMIAERLQADYAELIKGARGLLDEARALPTHINDDYDLKAHATLIERLRDSASRLKAFHITEKEPHLRAGQAVDTFFFSWWEKLARRNAKDKPGAADILQARVNDFMNRKLAEERRVREEAAAAARAEEERIRREQAEAQRRADEAAAAAARARKAENVAAHEKQALEQAAAAEQLRAQQLAAQQISDDARIDTLAKSADMVRTRLDGGPMVTMRQVPVVLIEDVTKLNKELLWAHLKEEHVLMALKAWAKTTSHKKQMDGAVIKMVDEAVVR